MMQGRMQEEFVIVKRQAKMLECVVNTLKSFEGNNFMLKKLKKKQHNCLYVGEISDFLEKKNVFY